MEKIKIYYSIKGNGFVFGLLAKDIKAINESFPDAQPAKAVVVNYDVKGGFENYRPHLEKRVFPILFGFANEQDLKKIHLIEFIKTPDMTVTYTIEQANELEIPSLSR